jgi:hypothetical protein
MSMLDWQNMQVEDILDVREWEQYAEFIRQMAELVDEVWTISLCFLAASNH